MPIQSPADREIAAFQQAANGPAVGIMFSSNQEKICFGKTEEAYNGFGVLLREMIDRSKSMRVLDIGGGAQPQLSCSEISKRGIDYTLLDISEAELAYVNDCYKKVVMDISGETFLPREQYDIVFSRFVLEHVRDIERLHQNVWALLKPGGIAVHFFPTLFALPFVVNWLLPERIGNCFLSQERRNKGKFVAHYKWCVGPTEKAVRRMERMGFEVIEYAGFFGHGYYDRVPFMRYLHKRWRNLLLRFPVASLTSFARIILRKPSELACSGLLPES